LLLNYKPNRVLDYKSVRIGAPHLIAYTNLLYHKLSNPWIAITESIKL